MCSPTPYQPEANPYVLPKFWVSTGGAKGTTGGPPSPPLVYLFSPLQPPFAGPVDKSQSGTYNMAVVLRGLLQRNSKRTFFQETRWKMGVFICARGYIFSFKHLQCATKLLCPMRLLCPSDIGQFCGTTVGLKAFTEAYGNRTPLLLNLLQRPQALDPIW